MMNYKIYKHRKYMMTGLNFNIAFSVGACYFLKVWTEEHRQHIKLNYLSGCLLKSELQ